MSLAALLLAAAVVTTADTPDVLAEAQARFAQTASYRTTVDSRSTRGGHSVIRYSYRKPGFIRMDFVSPHPGAMLIYSPQDGKVRLRPFGPQKFPLLTLPPTDALIRDKNGHRVDQSDIGTLLSNARNLQRNGSISQQETTLNGQPAWLLDISGDAGRSVQGVHRYQIWLTRDNQFPVKVISYNASDQVLETVLMQDVAVNVDFPARFFEW